MIGSDSVHFTVVFDALLQPYRYWWFIAPGLSTAVIGLVLLVIAKRIKAKQLFLILPGLLIALSALWSLSAFVITYGDYLQLRTALRTGAYRLVEGRVVNFVSSVNRESFTVAGRAFTYSPWSVQAGFNRTRSRGGPPLNGALVKIAEVHGAIARLEIAAPSEGSVARSSDRQETFQSGRNDGSTGRCWPKYGIIAAFLAAAFLGLRVSAFRVDRPGRRAFLGVPYLWNWKYLDRSNFTKEGQRILTWLWVATLAFLLFGLLGMSMCT